MHRPCKHWAEAMQGVTTFCMASARTRKTGCLHVFLIGNRNPLLKVEAVEIVFSGSESFDYGWDFRFSGEISSFGRLFGSFSGSEKKDLIESYLEVVEGVWLWKWSKDSGGLEGSWMEVWSLMEGSQSEVVETEFLDGVEIKEEVGEGWEVDRDRRSEKGYEHGPGRVSQDDVDSAWSEMETGGRELPESPSRGENRAGSSGAEDSADDGAEEVQDGSSRMVERALGCSAGSATQGKLVSASGQLVPCGRRPKRLFGSNVRHIKTCIRPRRHKRYGQEGFTSSSLRPGLVVGPGGGRYPVETTGCPRTRYRTTYHGVRQAISPRKRVVEIAGEQKRTSRVEVEREV